MLEWVLNDIVGRAILAGIGIAVPAAAIGCFLIWRRMAFFGDALGHTAVLGVALGAILQINIYCFIVVICLVVSLLLGRVSKRSYLPADIWLSIFSYGALAIGIMLMAKTPWLRLEPETILFGDILAIDYTDLITIYAAGAILAVLLFYFWRALIQLTVDEDLAAAAGINVGLFKTLFLFVMAIVTAVGLKTVGALMLPGLMIIPAITVSRSSNSPEQMILTAIIVSIAAVVIGITQSFYFDLLTGPSIVVASLSILIVTRLWQFLKTSR